MFTIFVVFFMGIYQLIFATPLQDKIDLILNEQQFQGTVLVAQSGRILHCKGYGYANFEHQILNSPDTVFRLASVSKQFTAVAILQLQENGLLNVHDSIGTYLPDYPRGDEITIHHLLTHTSGIAEVTDFPNLSRIQRHPSTPKTVMAHFKDLPLQFSPGADCVYCDSGYIVLGAIIEAITGTTYEAYVQENLFNPIDLKQTYYDHNQSIIQNRAAGYIQTEKGVKNAEFIEMSFPHAAGSLAATVKDLYTWNCALQSEALLSKESLSALTTAHAANSDGELTYGYGLRIGPQNKGIEDYQTEVIGHFGTIEGFRAALLYYSEFDITIIALSNVENTDIYSVSNSLSKIILHISYWR